jgi:hypothetical protein
MKRAALIAGTAALAAVGCGTSFVPTRLSQPVVGGGPPGGSGGGLRVEARRVLVTDDLVSSGVGEDSALAVELAIANGGAAPITVSAVSFSCRMEVDATRPAETRSLTPSGGGEGQFPGQLASDESALSAVTVPPGQWRAYWVLFHGYRFPDSDVPRRIVMTVQGESGHRLELVLADPGLGNLRWQVTPARGGWMFGLQNTSLFGSHLRATAVSTELARMTRLGKLLLDVGLTSRVLVQTQGVLVSPTSSFAGTGVAARLAAPFFEWGPWHDPRRLAAYGGAQAELLVAIEPPPPPGSTMPPSYYGALSFEGGLELEIGALRVAATPFPLSYAGARPLPRWLLRLGYTHWLIGHGASDGYTTNIALSW